MTPSGVGSRSGVNLHHPQTAMAGDTSGPGTAKYFLIYEVLSTSAKICNLYLSLSNLNCSGNWVVSLCVSSD